MKLEDIGRGLDLAGQLAMLFPLFLEPVFSPGGFAFAYLLVGLWQVLSFMFHCAASPGGRFRRKNYGIALGIVLILIAATSALRLGGAETTLVIFGAGCGAMAIWYFSIGVAELNTLVQSRQHRREIHWKL